MYKLFKTKLIKKVSAIAALAICIFTLFGVNINNVSAAEIRENENLTVEEDETINDDLYIGTDESGKDIIINGVVNGDVFAGGENITIDGVIAGYLYAAGTDIKITGTVAKSAFIGGNTVTNEGKIGENLYVGGNTVSNSGTVAGDVFAGANKFDMTGTIGDDIKIGANEIVIKGSVLGDAFVGGNIVDIDPEKVSGKLNVGASQYNSEISEFVNENSINFDSAKFREQFKEARIAAKAAIGSLTFLNLGMKFIWFVSLTLAGFLLLKLAPVKANKITNELTESPEAFLKSVGIGILSSIIIGIATFLALPTIIGVAFLPLIAGFLLFYKIYWEIWFDKTAGKFILGLIDEKKIVTPFVELLIGRGARLVIMVIKLIPIFGWLISTVYNFVGSMAVLGAMVNIKLSYLREVKGKGSN